MENLAYYNGRVTEINEMMVPANDRGFYFGDGVYEAAMAYGNKIFALNEHIERFYRSAGKIEMELPFSKKELKEILIQQTARVDGSFKFIYWQGTRGTAPRNHVFPGADVKANLYIAIKQQKPKDFNMEYNITSVEDRRAQCCDIKTLNLLQNVLAAQKAKVQGYQETVFIREGYVTESSHSNVSIIKNGVFQTHPTDWRILPGIERAHLIRYCKELGIPVEEKAFTLQEMLQADEIIISSTSGACMRATRFEGKLMGGKNRKIIDQLRDKYWKEFEDQTGFVHGKDKVK